MVKLTENKVAEINTSALEKRARDIRDAVVTKSVTVEMVGSLFADLITACGNVRDALEVTPDGRIVPLKEGVGKVNVVATVKTSIYKTLTIAVVPPRIRLTGGGMRLDGKGNIRLT